MSDYEVHHGKMYPTGKTLTEFLDKHGVEYEPDDAMEALYDNFHNKAVLIDSYVWTVDSEELPATGFNVVEQNSDGSVSFVMMYYNGGCCFSEALSFAVRKKLVTSAC